MNTIDTPVPLEQEYPSLAEHIRQVANNENPVVRTIVVGQDSVKLCCRFGNDPLVWRTRRITFPGRNDPCSCGSGRKYKKCCGK